MSDKTEISLDDIKKLEDQIDELEKELNKLLLISKSKEEVKEEVKEKVEEETKPTLKTEDSGKIFEKAITLAFDIEYDGPYKYSIEDAMKMKDRLTKLNDHFPKCVHTAKKGARYDFTSIEGNKHLSAKTTKKGDGKVAPQVIGQATPEKFCSVLGLEYKGIKELKQYIQENVPTILSEMVKYTFDCTNVYYHVEKNTIELITLKSEIDWSKYTYKWTCDYNDWKNSSVLKIEIGGVFVNLCEFQFHTKSRKNMANRWFYQNILTHFKECFDIVEL
jgi:hypothetical protein